MAKAIAIAGGPSDKSPVQLKNQTTHNTKAKKPNNYRDKNAQKPKQRQHKPKEKKKTKQISNALRKTRSVQSGEQQNRKGVSVCNGCRSYQRSHQNNRAFEIAQHNASQYAAHQGHQHSWDPNCPSFPPQKLHRKHQNPDSPRQLSHSYAPE